MSQSATDNAQAPDLTDDAFLGGALHIFQPRRGYRAGIDAVLLAACVGKSAGRVLDVGAGVGTAGLCVARRVPSASVVLVEQEADLVRVADQNIRRNDLADRVSAMRADVLAPISARATGLEPSSFDVVISNPPYHDALSGTPSADALKRGSHAMPAEALPQWCAFLASLIRAGGTAVIIHKAGALQDLLRALPGTLGAITILAVHPRAIDPAIRVIVRAKKGARSPLTLLPPFVLHGGGQGYTNAAERVLRHGDAIDLGG